MPKQSVFRVIKRWKRYQPAQSYKDVPHRTRGLYVLYRAKKAQGSDRKLYEVTYIGVAGLGPGGTGGIRGRLLRHFNARNGTSQKPQKLEGRNDQNWTHYSMFEVHDNVTREEIRELETLLLAIFKHDRRVALTNKQLDSRKLIGLRSEKGWKDQKR